MDVFGDEKNIKKHLFFECNKCLFKCSKKGDWNRHLRRAKHVSVTLCGKQVTQKTSHYTCSNCKKTYASRNGLWKHRQTCHKLQDINEINIHDKDSLVLHLLKQNGELQQKIMELSTDKSITINSNNVHSNNPTFNLQFFLNETCKDAMNMTDFVSSVRVSLEDLENTGRQGYIEGISDIIINKLSKIETHLRPLHCSDSKREVLYIKENNEWTKDSNAIPILTKAIKTIANENIKQINKWRENYPDCVHADSKKNKLYLNIVSNSMNGLTKEEGEKNINKIITNVGKQVVIHK